MSKIFTRTFRVRWSELDASGTVAPAAYLRYLVETAYDWGAVWLMTTTFLMNDFRFWGQLFTFGAYVRNAQRKAAQHKQNSQ